MQFLRHPKTVAPHLQSVSELCVAVGRGPAGERSLGGHEKLGCHLVVRAPAAGRDVTPRFDLSSSVG